MKPSDLIRGLRLRTKILVPLVGLVAASVALVLLILSGRVRSQTHASIESVFAKSGTTFEQFLALREDRLIGTAILLSEHSNLKAALSVAQAPTITTEMHDTVEENVEFLSGVSGMELASVVVTNRDGNLILRTDQPQTFNLDMSELPWIRRAARGEDPDGTGIWIQRGSVWQVATVPVFRGTSGDLLGTLTLCAELGENAVRELRQNTGTEVSFLVDHRVAASTLEEESQVDLAKSTFTFESEIQGVLGDTLGTGPLQYELSRERYLVTFAAIGEGPDGEQVTYALASSLDRALAPLRRLQLIIMLVGLGAVMVAFAVAYRVSDGIARPVRRLVEGAHLIDSGNYDFSIEVENEDEIGTLARAFNEMAAGLRERFQMEKYVSSSTLDMIRRADADGGGMTGERKNVTVLFSDIRGFTSFSEKVDPEEVVSMLNMYLSKQARMVSRFHGVVDKYVGDELVAVFEGENMVDNAVLCAVEIQREMKGLNEQLPKKIQVGIGVNTGMVVMGPVGSEERMDFTVLGSNVNLGARLCSTAEPGQILISESSYRLLKIKVRTTPLDAISVKGFSRPVQVYAVG